MESPQAVSIFGSDESEDDAETPRSISLIEFSSSSSSLTSTTSTQATMPFSYMEGSPNNRLSMNLINPFGSIDDDDGDDLSLSFPLPAGLLEMPPFFHPTWSISEYGELNGNDHVRNYPRFYMFGDTMMDLAFKSSDKIGFGWLLRSAYEGKVEIGFFGYNTRWLYGPFEDLVIRVAERCGPPAPLLITIWLGYEDSRLSPFTTHVPLLEFEQHLRHYVRTILDHPGLEDVRIVLISPPPANIKSPRELSFPFPDTMEIQRNMVLTSRAHRTWLEKRKYAEKVVQVGEEFEDETMRVAVIDLWQALIRWACGRNGNENPGDFDELDELDMLPGCGLPNARQFGTEIFNDNLHLGPKAHEILAHELLDLIKGRWPEISPEALPHQKLAPSVYERLLDRTLEMERRVKEGRREIGTQTDSDLPNDLNQGILIDVL
ncbi:hypothetical protein Egran_06781 [Elaphomyces granulatus]|uniref:SGNH hydrolase-type esterase domain-containing protein n=1 Tax=Elaphomyces granulatus TaxID=519963 RepID=A0A232LMU5_9EURO|nr:hypothetical protein Egran_06781 [Elaphomyces granulatus]